jgi:hypothetical protein
MKKTCRRISLAGANSTSVIWWVAKLRRQEHIRLPRRTRRVTLTAIRALQLAVVEDGIITVERTVAANAIESSENQWGFGQIAAMVSLLGTA